MKKIKVCCFIEKWVSGGIESFSNNVFHNLDISLFQIDIIASEMCGSIFTEPLQKLGVSFYELSGSRWKLMSNYRLLKKLLKNNDYDVIYINAYHAVSMIYAKLAHSLNIPQIIVHSHCSAIKKSCTRFLKVWAHKLSSRVFSKYVTDFLACSGLAAEFMFPKKVIANGRYVFIPNGIETDKFTFNEEHRNNVRQELNLQDTFVIGCVGRLCEEKNQLFLLDVFAQAVKIKDCRLVLVGKGELEEVLRKKAEALGISDKVIFYGASNEVNRLICGFDCLAMPSLFEGLMIVAIEAQCIGLPIVCSDRLAKETFVGEGIKAVALEKSAKEWAQAIFSCEKTGTYSDSNKSALIKAGFDIKNTAATIRNIFLKGFIDE
ncbi:MAG: glycosyltransferase family 1 protein [Ruminococcaceae bacterium]|nr:glycosyltransferase family 1 protein [Oscillospiraceae bacterium]